VKPLGLTVNGHVVQASIEPRTSLADFLRDHENLTGTHLGCEHGVCGACTVLIDGEPARSCITYAVCCEGASITTIEGLDGDEITGELRAGFSREHALQCGYCTPGMLVGARDVVLRGEVARERDIRVAMSGHLCRCTGYVGVVRAIESVLASRRARGIATAPVRSALGPVGAGHAAATAARERLARAAGRPVPSRTAPGQPVGDFIPAASFQHSFNVQQPIAAVWDFFGRVPDVAACLPGVTVTSAPGEAEITGNLRIKVGPLAAEFHGVAEMEREPSTYSGTIRGRGKDARSSSAARGLIRYRLQQLGERSTRVDAEVGYALTGTLAQVGRLDLVREIAARLIEAFVRELERRMGSPEQRAEHPAARPAELRAGSLVLSMLVRSLRGWLRRLWRRPS
jgi:aerobic carbon-monoxide dehydrogenase small subunit